MHCYQNVTINEEILKRYFLLFCFKNSVSNTSVGYGSMLFKNYKIELSTIFLFNNLNYLDFKILPK